MVRSVIFTSLAVGALSFPVWFLAFAWAGLELGFVELLSHFPEPPPHPVEVREEIWEIVMWLGSLCLSFCVGWLIFSWGKKFIPPR
jgi:hypothetical protein